MAARLVAYTAVAGISVGVVSLAWWCRSRCRVVWRSETPGKPEGALKGLAFSTKSSAGKEGGKVDPRDHRPREGYQACVNGFPGHGVFCNLLETFQRLTDWVLARFLSWDDYFMVVAYLRAPRSKDAHKQVRAGSSPLAAQHLAFIDCQGACI